MERSRGFTLLEILLVLVLLAVSSVAVISTFPVSQSDEAKKTAQSLYQRIQLLNEDAILSGRDFGLSLDAKKGNLRFLTLTHEGWQLVDKHQFKSELTISPDIELDFQVGGNIWKQDDRLFEPGSLFEEIFEEKKQEKPPQVFILSSGEVTPFILAIRPKAGNRDRSWRVVVHDNGQVQLLAPGEQDEEA